MAKKTTKKVTKKTTAKKAAKKTTKKAATKKVAAKKTAKKTAKKKTAPKAETELLNFIQPTPAPTAEEISHAAYLNYISRQQEGVAGDEAGDWLAAEESLKKKS
jgi:hypothetical protein